jgi:nifR3 family TIM-barrel protein
MNFWKQLPQPFFVLAPMADVTDAAFRMLFAKYSKIPGGRLDVLYTEFVSADGLFRGGFDALEPDLWYTDAERPIVAQFFSRDTDLMKRASELAVERGFDGIDINMGCPDKNVCKQGAGAAMIRDPEHAQQVIYAAMEGAGELPVSIKTRIGYTANELETWLPALLETKPATIILHARTKRQMSKVPADWSVIKRAVELRDALAPDILIVGNGDVSSMKEARARVHEAGCDGVMIARGAFGAPWFFREEYEPTLRERLEIALEHILLYEEVYKGEKPFHIMKKHLKAYAQGFDGAKELRVQLLNTEEPQEAVQILKHFLDNLEK